MTLLMREIFEKPVDRPIDGVIKADDDASLRTELDEYVIAGEIGQRLSDFFDAYNNYSTANGVWISGFFGSGKSHLLKMLALVLENRKVEGAGAADIFLAKLADEPMLAGALRKAVAVPSKSILFNIDQKADVISKTDVDALLAVFQKVFDDMCGYFGKQPHIAQFADEVLRQVDAVFDTLLSAIAAPLQQPEFAGELAAARTRVPAALAELSRLLRQKGLEVVGTELERGATFAGGLSVVGRLDLLVRHASQGLGVIDLKWTRSANRRRTELAEGRALQLATYGAIADPTGGDPSPGAYYLLNQRRLLGPIGAIVAEEEIETSRSLADTWTDLLETWRLWRDLAAQGAVLGTGLPEAADHFPAGLGITPGENPCRYCELTSLCRVTQEAN